MSDTEVKNWGCELRVIIGYVQKNWSSVPNLADEMIGVLCLRAIENPKINYFYICSNIYNKNKSREKNLSADNPKLLNRLTRNVFYENYPSNVEKRIDFEERIEDFDEATLEILKLFSQGYTDYEICRDRDMSSKDLHILKETILELLGVDRKLPDYHNPNNYTVVTSEGEKNCKTAKKVWEILNEFPNSEVYSCTGKNVKMWEKKV